MFFILSLNISMICLYCRYAGYNYKSIEHQKNLKKIGCVAFYWTITIALKNIPYYLKELQFDWEKPSDDDQDDQNTFQTLGIFLFFFTISFINDVIPLVLVIDSQFINIFSLEFIREYNQNEKMNNNQNLLDSMNSFDKKFSGKNRFILSEPGRDSFGSKLSESQSLVQTCIVHIDDPKLFSLREPLKTDWYNSKTKHKLGKLYHGKLKYFGSANETDCIARHIDMERMSAYVIEKF